ncbi:MAG: hypothetical protein VB858_11210 [Planctomycetaceae bacterium]
MSDDDSRLSEKEAAERLGVTGNELRDLRVEGRIRGHASYGNWLFTAGDVSALQAELEAEATQRAVRTDQQTGQSDRTEPASTRSYTPSKYEPGGEASFSLSGDQSTSDDTLRHSKSGDRVLSQSPAPKDSPRIPVTESSGLDETSELSETSEPGSPSVPGVAPASGLSLEELVLSDQPIESARIIEALAARHCVGFAQAAGVVDGFWDHLLNTQHYKPGRRKLHMPHFGVFRLKRNRKGETELHFTSRPLAELRLRHESSGRHSPDTAWIEHWLRHPASSGRLKDLSLKRRLAVTIAEDTGLDLHTTFLLLWDLVETITGIMVSDRTDIRWARRGVMHGHSSSGASSHYEFRTYRRLRDQLPPLAARPPRKVRPETGCMGIILCMTFFGCVIGIACSNL